jgi:argininosuccinate synthase
MSETPWADSPIHEMIREAGLDNAAPLAASTCSDELAEHVYNGLFFDKMAQVLKDMQNAQEQPRP